MSVNGERAEIKHMNRKHRTSNDLSRAGFKQPAELHKTSKEGPMHLATGCY